MPFICRRISGHDDNDDDDDNDESVREEYGADLFLSCTLSWQNVLYAAAAAATGTRFR